MNTARRWLAPEVVQSSAMDCGPAALKCLLEGHGIAASYGRLREACQTDVDGTSIDTLEVVAQQLGLQAEQIMIPLDHVVLPAAAALPALVVVRHDDGATHFVVLWQQLGRWLQVMDPATGRRWVQREAFMREVHQHELGVAAAGWREWAADDEFITPLRRRLALLGASDAATADCLARALADESWFAIAALDASVRLAEVIRQAGGIARGAAAVRLAQALFERTCASPDDIFTAVPAAYWSAVPDPQGPLLGEPRVLLRGAVLVRVAGRALQTSQDAANDAANDAAPPLPRELAAALAEPPPHPLRSVWQLLRQDGLLGPFALCAAMALAAGAIVIETLLLRGLFDITAQLGLPHQRLLALLALLAFAALLLALEVPIVAESLRHGRHLEARLRMALLAKLPRLADRYLQSRSISDMAERSHSIQHSRQVPALGLSFVQSVAELLLTVLGVALISPGSTALAGASALCAMLLPALFQPWLAERDLRLRHHASALHGFYLDALTGLIPVRAHRAGRAVRRQHEGLLVEWVRASRGLIATTLAASGTQGLVCTLLSAGLLVNHFLHAGGVGGADLLLVYWTLKLPALGNGVGALLRQYPQQRNILLRLLEPLAAPEEPTAATTSEARPDAAAAVAISIRNGSVLAAGQRILRDVNLHIAPGEHVAVIGASGAGKSSLIGLLLGWHRLASGQLQIDGQALDAGSQQTLRRHTAWVDPGVQIWNRSFLDNLGYASADESLAQVGEVTAAAQLHGVLQKLPQGLRSVLGEGGALLSGGEGQRLRLARAFMQSGARLVLLDEPFRGLDRGQRQALLAEARHWWQAQTLLCVTHDVGQTLAFARVLVVEQGRIVEDGAPAALAAEDSRYAALLAAEAQLRSSLWEVPQILQIPPAPQGSAAAPAWRRVHIENGIARAH